jgi:diguanylate cyclase (GGDEF)-like protein/PAS domain S-box-containing protein
VDGNSSHDRHESSPLAVPGRTETLYQTLLDAAPNAILGTDERGRITLVNAVAESLFGYAAEELLGRPVEVLVPERVRPGHDKLRASFGRHPANRPMGKGRDLYARRKDGTEFPVEISLGAARTPSGELLVQAVIVDITERKRAEAELERRAARQTALAQLGERALEGASPDELMLEAVAIASEGLDTPFARVLEYEGVGEGDRGELHLRAAVGFRPELIGVQVEHAASFAGQALAQGEPVVMDDARFLHGMLEDHGAVGGASVTIGRREAPYGVLGVHTASARAFSQDDLSFLQAVANVLSDAVERHRWEEHIRHEALHDPLTGLANRTLLVERLNHWAAGREPVRAAVVFVDLDHFKFVNDTLGHDAGDELLRAIGPRLRTAVRAGDTVARFGGDEFVVLCERVESEAGAVELARRVEEAFAAPFAVQGKEVEVAPSLGVAVAAAGDVSPEALLRNADEAMYRAKKLGRGRLVVFDADLDLRLRERLELEAELRRAVAVNAFAVRYQPVVELDSGRLTGFEALVRWPRGEATVGPDQFIPLAEETGLIRPLGRWVLEQACAQAAQWRARFPTSAALSVSVNLSARQVVEPGLPETVAGVLAATNLPADALRLEITETVLLDDAEIVRAQLEALHALGVRLVLDDFGTGYSSLSHIKHHPIDTIKIDRSFVEGIDRDRDSQAIAGAVVQMAEGLRMQVIAEGVSEPAQARALSRLGCRLAQGYLYDPPLDVAGAERVLAQTR